MQRVNGEDGDYSFRATGEVDLPKPKTLVPYKDLTETTVLGWVKAKLDADNAGTVAAIEKAVDDGVNEQKTPVHGVGKPWQNKPTYTHSSQATRPAQDRAEGAFGTVSVLCTHRGAPGRSRGS